MRAAISVIIPTLNAEQGLPACLAALMEGVEAGLIRELIHSDGGSQDNTRQISEAVGAQWVSGPPSRGGQLRRGAQAANGRWLLFLHADTVLQEGWSGAIADFLKDEDFAGYGLLWFDAKGMPPKIVATWANLRSRWFGLPYGDQGMLISRALYESVGGYPDIPLMEDVKIARDLRGRLKPLDVIARTSGAKYVKEGWIRRGAKNFGLLLRFFSGADPNALAQSYRRSDRHP